MAEWAKAWNRKMIRVGAIAGSNPGGGNFFFLFLIPYFIEKHVYCINENRKFGKNFEKNIFQKFLFSIKMQPIMAKKAN